MFLGAASGIVLRKPPIISSVSMGIMFSVLGPVFYSVYTIPHLSSSGALGFEQQAYIYYSARRNKRVRTAKWQLSFGLDTLTESQGQRHWRRLYRRIHGSRFLYVSPIGVMAVVDNEYG